jgi:antirestriction protein ArdC
MLGRIVTYTYAEQIKGVPPLELKEHQWDSIEQADIILKGSGANINHDGKGRAYIIYYFLSHPLRLLHLLQMHHIF